MGASLSGVDVLPDRPIRRTGILPTELPGSARNTSIDRAVRSTSFIAFATLQAANIIGLDSWYWDT